jgi:hypothetical protein
VRFLGPGHWFSSFPSSWPSSPTHHLSCFRRQLVPNTLAEPFGYRHWTTLAGTTSCHAHSDTGWPDGAPAVVGIRAHPRAPGVGRPLAPAHRHLSRLPCRSIAGIGRLRSAASIRRHSASQQRRKWRLGHCPAPVEAGGWPSPAGSGSRSCEKGDTSHATYTHCQSTHTSPPVLTVLVSSFPNTPFSSSPGTMVSTSASSCLPKRSPLSSSLISWTVKIAMESFKQSSPTTLIYPLARHSSSSRRRTLARSSVPTT